MNNDIIYGKSNIERIVGLEPKGPTAEIFIQEPDGSIRSKFVKNRYWILSDRRLSKEFVRLKGDLHYKYGRQFETQEDLYFAKNAYKNQDTFSISNPKEALMVKDGYTFYKGMRPNEVSILSFDLETTGFKHDDEAKVLIISNTFRSNGKIQRKLFGYCDYESQAEMIEEWIDWVKEINPSIIAGHNIFSYDFPYLQFVCDREGVNLDLGRDGSPIKTSKYESKFRVDGSRDLHYHKVSCYGRELVDTMFLAYKYDIGRKYESYGLKPIIKQEGLEVQGRVFYDASQIRLKYHIPEEWEKIKSYAEFDADDALNLFDLFVPPFFYTTQSIPKSFQAVVESASGSQINSMMIRSYLQESHSLPKASQQESFEGAISIGNPGIYYNGLKVDVASLYPSIMREYKIGLREKDPKNYFIELTEYFSVERLKNKKLAKETGERYYDDLQSSQKISANSLYGFMGAPGLLFNMPKSASEVTERGREILNRALRWAEEKNFNLINADTDSITFCKQDGSSMAEMEQKILVSDLNSRFPKMISWEFDGYFECVIVLAAKNYILYDGKKIKTKGSAIRDPKKEPALREFIQSIINAILNKQTNYEEIYNRYVKEIDSITEIKRWASRKTISEKTITSERTNETKIVDAIRGSNYVEGDRIYTYFKSDSSLGLAELFDGDYDKKTLLKKLYNTAEIFESILPVKDLFPNYSLKKTQPLLANILAS